MKAKEFNKYYTLLGLYLAQSIPMSFFSTIIPLIMREENYSLSSIGFFQLIKLPWIIKFLWAPFVDNTSHSSRHYRRWILASEIFYAVVIFSIGFLDLQTDFNTILVLIIIALIASATQDIATDAFAILILKQKERSMGNSMQSAGSFIGTMVGSGIMLILYDHWYETLGWMHLLFFLAIFVLIALIPVSLFRNHTNKSLKRSRKNVSPVEFIHFFRQKKIGGHILLLFLFYSSIIGILTMIKPYFIDLGYEIRDYAIISGIFGTAFGALMAIPAGMYIRRRGVIKSIWLFPVVNLLAATYFFGLTFTNHHLVLIYVGIALLWGAYSMSSVFIYTLGMKIVRPGKEGTDFTIQIVITHLSSIIIAVTSGKVADALNYQGLFAVEIGMALLVLALIPFIFRKEFYLGRAQSADKK